MNFDELNKLIPYARYGKAKSLSMSPFNGVTLLLPGRHAEHTDPKGGDFCVCVDSEQNDWYKHEFTHGDLFKDIEEKNNANSGKTDQLLEDYFNIVHANSAVPDWGRNDLPGLHPLTFLHGVLCLAVAEHRRYHEHEPKLGGRYVPLRFSAGIVEGKWTAADAIERQRKGRVGVEWLEKDFGKTDITKLLGD
jgi:hypothetical protein